MKSFIQFLQEAVYDPYGVGGKKLGYSGQKKKKVFQVLWYIHPRMGLRVIDYHGYLDSVFTHAVWMKQEGIPTRVFDRLPRGRLEVNFNEQRVNEYLHKSKVTPEEVYKKLYRLYPQIKKLKFVTYKQMMDDGFDYQDEYDREQNSRRWMTA